MFAPQTFPLNRPGTTMHIVTTFELHEYAGKQGPAGSVGWACGCVYSRWVHKQPQMRAVRVLKTPWITI